MHKPVIESVLRAANVPITSNEIEEVNALGYRGVLLNRSEILSWNGPIPISQYKFNNDSNPEIITKESSQPIEYNQDIQVRYLRPPTPPPAGDIIIREQPSANCPPAPPIIIRQTAPDPFTPEPIIIREPPPTPPCASSRKVISIPGRVLDPLPRKVIIEKLAPLPPKPPAVIIEKWLPYKEAPRRVIFEPAPSPPAPEPVKNLIIQWKSPEACVKKKISYLGVSNADPKDYLEKYGPTLKNSHEYSSLSFEKPLVDDYSNELVGDVEALKYLDLATLEREGLGKYKHYLTGDNSKNQTTSVDYHPHIIHHSSTHTTITVNSGTRTCSYCGQPIQKFQLRT